MKHDNRGEAAKPIQNTVSSPKSTPNHPPIANAVSTAKESPNQKIQGSALPEIRK